MTKEQALQSGLKFTGEYERSAEPIKASVEKMRKQGYKAYCVRVPDDKLSRGYYPGACGYSVYVEKSFFLNEQIKEALETIEYLPKMYLSIIARHEEELLEFCSKKDLIYERLSNARAELEKEQEKK
jgi:hypothetical protein